ncbi:hypothetical protein MKEN_00200400 [Mycena kentingensis (nom. inval.)]|nr:hypothetical protein MKEN_00200400 [Mycena kentingensis (nom. inval.)]
MVLTESQNVKTQLEALFRGDLRAVVESAYEVKEYSLKDATVPCIRVAGHDPFGTPLSTREAPILGSAGKNVGVGVFEIPAKQITFGNPDWHTWVTSEATQLVAGKLSLDGGDPVFVLDRLVLEYAGSHMKDLAASRPISGVPSTCIGALIVVLPSQFEGGRRTLSFAGTTRSVNGAPTSGTTTTLIAAHSDVAHTFSPLTSGYRLSLVYTIKRAPGPIVPPTDLVAQKLRDVLSKWKSSISHPNSDSEGGDTFDTFFPRSASPPSPTYLAVLLNNCYSHSSASAPALKAPDTQILERLRPLASVIGFTLYIAQMRVEFLYEIDPDEFVMADYGDKETHVVVERILDLDGRTIVLEGFRPQGWTEENDERDDLGIPEDDKFINGPLLDHNIAPDEETSDNIPASIFNNQEFYNTEKWFRTALLLWPNTNLKRTADVNFGGPQKKAKVSVG